MNAQFRQKLIFANGAPPGIANNYASLRMPNSVSMVDEGAGTSGDLKQEGQKTFKLVDLLIIERKHGSLWWSVLNEMLLACELPEWVRVQGIGTAADFERFDLARRATNVALFGIPRVVTGDDPTVILGNQQMQIDIIEAERTFAIRWWTMLNESRCKKQLPEWVIKLSVGNGPDIERWHSKAGAVNRLLFGTEYVRGSTTEAKAGRAWLRRTLA